MKTLFAAILAFAAVPALATDTAKQTGKDTGARPDRQEVVCKNTFVVGSKIPTKMCHTREQWAEMERGARESRRRHGSGSSQCRGDSLC